MIQYSIVIFIYSYPCCFHLVSAFIFNCHSLSLFFLPVPVSFLLHFTSPPSPSSQPIIFTSILFSSFSSSFPPVPTLFYPLFSCQLLPHFFHSHLFFGNQSCSYPLFPYFIPYSSLFLPLKFSAPPQSPHLASFNET